MPFNDIFRLRLYQRLHGAQVVNVLHFVQDDPLPTVGAQELANDFMTNMTTPLRNRAVPGLAFETVEVQSIVPFSGGAAVATFPGGTVGAVAGSAQSATLCEVITIYTSRGGRRGRGRIYLAGAEASATNNLLNGVWQTNQVNRTTALATAIMARYASALGGIQFKLGVWSKASGPKDPPWSSSQFTRATALTVRTIVRTQRRRQVGVGR